VEVCIYIKSSLCTNLSTSSQPWDRFIFPGKIKMIYYYSVNCN
ncbi:unnamed protein product, partial [Brassica oleracea var. botrytis]